MCMYVCVWWKTLLVTAVSRLLKIPQLLTACRQDIDHKVLLMKYNLSTPYRP